VLVWHFTFVFVLGGVGIAAGRALFLRERAGEHSDS
jgi:hypothetical protein